MYILDVSNAWCFFPVKTLTVIKEENSVLRSMKGMREQNCDCAFVCFAAPAGVGDGRGGLACYSPWGRRVGPAWVTELNWTTEVYLVTVLLKGERSRDISAGHLFPFWKLGHGTSLVLEGSRLLPLQGLWVRSLAGDLRSHVWHSQKIKIQSRFWFLIPSILEKRKKERSQDEQGWEWLDCCGGRLGWVATLNQMTSRSLSEQR